MKRRRIERHLNTILLGFNIVLLSFLQIGFLIYATKGRDQAPPPPLQNSPQIATPLNAIPQYTETTSALEVPAIEHVELEQITRVVAGAQDLIAETSDPAPITGEIVTGQEQLDMSDFVTIPLAALTPQAELTAQLDPPDHSPSTRTPPDYRIVRNRMIDVAEALVRLNTQIARASESQQTTVQPMTVPFEK